MMDSAPPTPRAAPSTAPLEFEGLVLDGTSSPLTLSVPQHHTVSIVGDADSGVNRLAAIALGLDPIPVGRALLMGENLAVMARRNALAFRRQVGYVPAGDGLLQNLSLAENVALPLRFGSGMSPREIGGRLKVMMGQVRLAGVGHLRPADANGEQRRRAALARALAFDPDLVILDHPFDGVPARTQLEILDIARGGELAFGARRTVFIISQSLPERLLNRIENRYRLVRGKLQQEG